MRDLLFCISGPSGVGKGTLVRELIKRDASLALSVSCTTRPPRKGEREGIDYFFIDRATFEEDIRRDAFVEYDEHFGNYYGTPRSYVEKQLAAHRSVLLEIDVVGALNVKRAYHARGEGDKVVTILIAPPDLASLEARLLHRGSETREQLELRRARVGYELSMAKEFDYTVVNDDLSAATDELAAVIHQEKTK